jgi:hypothetical protein
MKNLFTFVTPEKAFKGERATMVKLQIDNCYELGWKKEDIVFFTNFEFEYNGIKSTIIGDESYCTVPNRGGSTKTTTVAWLLEHDMLEKGVLYFDHDFDAYQMDAITEQELELDGYDAGFPTYGYSRKWALGSFFFKSAAKDIFMWIKETIYKIQNEDERALRYLTDRNVNNINSRIKKLNVTYNFGMRHTDLNWKNAIHPIKVVHFHPYYFEHSLPEKLLDTFMYGKNPMGVPIMNERLIKLFRKYGYK